MTKSPNSLTCEVLGPSPPKLTLNLKMGNQNMKGSNQLKLVTQPEPKAGLWQCLLSDNGKVLLEAKIEGESGPMFHGLTPSPCLLSWGTLPGLVETTQPPNCSEMGRVVGEVPRAQG